MKYRYLALLVAAACISLASVTVDAQRIMPMGDSVTSRGDSPESSYRYWLYHDLTNAGYQFDDTAGGTLTFVGNESGVSDGAPANPWPYEAYEGGNSSFDGWTTQNGVDDINSANSQSPDIVLLDLGANDYNDGAAPLKTNLLEVQANLETIINGFAAQNSSIVILLAVPTPWVIPAGSGPGPHQFMNSLGSAVTKAAHDERQAGVDVVVVNLRGGFNPRVGADTTDGSHPDVKGEQMIAKKFFNALRPVLKRMGVQPQRVRR